MTMLAAPLGLLASLSMAAMACCHTLPAEPDEHAHHRDKEHPGAPDSPGACHATLCNGSGRKVRTFP